MPVKMCISILTRKATTQARHSIQSAPMIPTVWAPTTCSPSIYLEICGLCPLASSFLNAHAYHDYITLRESLLFKLTHYQQISSLLRAIEPSASIINTEARDLLNGPANKLWELLQGDNFRAVKAGKLLARKRPSLIPIYDERVQLYFKIDNGKFWLPLHEALVGTDLLSQIDEALRPESLANDYYRSKITPLRLLDIAVWMR